MTERDTEPPHIVLPPKAFGDVPWIRFRQAKCFRFGRRGFEILYAVIHSAECAETDGAAEGLQAYASTMPDRRQASWHYACDRDSCTQSVREKDAAWHCPPLNDVSIGIELAGRAAQDAMQWDDDYSRSMLQWQLVPLLSDICLRHDIPMRRLDDETLRGGLETANQLRSRRGDAEEWAGLRTLCGGIVTHAQVARVFGKSTHYDPGPSFPLQGIIEAIQRRPG